MAQFAIVGIYDCHWYAKADKLADEIVALHPVIEFHKEMMDPFHWSDFCERMKIQRGWNIKRSPVIYEVLVDIDGKATLIGDINDFCEFAAMYFDIYYDPTSAALREMAMRNKHRFERGAEGHDRGHAAIFNVAIVNAPIKMLELLLMQLLSPMSMVPTGMLLNVSVFDEKTDSKILHGLVMEVTDMASPLLYKITVTSTMPVCFYQCNLFILAEDFSREPNEDLSLWISRVEVKVNNIIIAFNDRRTKTKDCRIIVGGDGPQCYVAEKSIYPLKSGPGQIIASGQYIAQKAKNDIAKIGNISAGCIARIHAWGWPGDTGAYIEVKDAVIREPDGSIQVPEEPEHSFLDGDLMSLDGGEDIPLADIIIDSEEDITEDNEIIDEGSLLWEDSTAPSEGAGGDIDSILTDADANFDKEIPVAVLEIDTNAIDENIFKEAKKSIKDEEQIPALDINTNTIEEKDIIAPDSVNVEPETEITPEGETDKNVKDGENIIIPEDEVTNLEEIIDDVLTETEEESVIDQGHLGNLGISEAEDDRADEDNNEYEYEVFPEASLHMPITEIVPPAVERKNTIILGGDVQGPWTEIPLEEVVTNAYVIFSTFSKDFLRRQRKRLYATVAQPKQTMLLVDSILNTIQIWFASELPPRSKQIKNLNYESLLDYSGYDPVSLIPRKGRLPVINVGVPCLLGSPNSEGIFMVQPAICVNGRWQALGIVRDKKVIKEVNRLWAKHAKFIHRDQNRGGDLFPQIDSLIEVTEDSEYEAREPEKDDNNRESGDYSAEEETAGEADDSDYFNGFSSFGAETEKDDEEEEEEEEE